MRIRQLKLSGNQHVSQLPVHYGVKNNVIDRRLDLVDIVGWKFQCNFVHVGIFYFVFLGEDFDSEKINSIWRFNL